MADTKPWAFICCLLLVLIAVLVGISFLSDDGFQMLLASHDTSVTFYSVTNPPWIYYDDNGKMVGIIPDLFDAMHIPEVTIYTASRGDVISHIKDKKNAFAGPIAKSSRDSDQYLWSDIVAQDSDALFARSDRDIHITDLSNLNAYRIGSLKNSSPIYPLVFGGYDSNSFFFADDLETLFEALVDEEIDLLAINKEIGIYHLFRNYEDPSAISLVYAFDDTTDRYFVFNKDISFLFHSQINSELTRLKTPDASGISEYERIVTSHLTSRDLSPVIYVATQNSPITYIAEDDVTVSGFAVDLVDAICDQLDILDTKATGITFISRPATAIEYVQKTPDAMLLSLSKTEQNEEQFKWVGPIGSIRPGVLGKLNNQTVIADINDLMPYRVGVVEGSISEIGILSTDFPAHQLVFATDSENLFSLLEAGVVDFIVDRDTELINIVKKSEDTKYTIVFFLDPIPQYFAFNADTADSIIHEFQDSFDNLKTQPGTHRRGTLTRYDEIFMRYFPQNILGLGYYVIGITSYDESDPWTRSIQSGIEEVFNKDSRIIYNTENLKMGGKPLDPEEAQAYTSAMYSAFGENYKDIHVDAFVTIGPEASFGMIELEKDGHLTATPHSHTYVTFNPMQSKLQGTGVILLAPIDETLSLAKALHPHASTVYAILPPTRGGLDFKALFMHYFQPYINDPSHPYTYRVAPDNLSPEDLITDIYSSGEPTIVLLWDYSFVDEQGLQYSISNIIGEFSSRLSDPIYTFTDQFNGQGVVGGYQISGNKAGKLVGTLTSRLLYGEDLSLIPQIMYRPDHPTLDAQVLSRFNIDTSLLPHNVKIINQQISELEIPRNLVIAVAAGFAILVLTILLLSYNKRRLLAIQKEVVSQRKFLENTIGHMPIGIAIVDTLANDLCIVLNERFAMYTGLPKEQLYGKELTSNKPFQKIKSLVLEKKAPISKEGTHLWPHNPIDRHLRFTVTPIYNTNEECAFIIIDIIDLTVLHTNKQEARESLARFGEFVEQNVAAIGFFLPVYEDGVFVGAVVEETNVAYVNMFSSLHVDAVGAKVTYETPGCEWLMEAFSKIQPDIKEPYAFKNLYLDALDRYISGYAFWCSENPAYLSVYITDKTEETLLRSAEMAAFEELEKNIFAMATLNDKIRNPLSVVMTFIEMDTLRNETKFIELVKDVDSFIDELDLGFSESESLYLAIKAQNEKEGRM